MKKVFSLLAVIAMVGFVSCEKKPEPTPEPTPEPEPDPVTATITASDVTVDEGATVQINATTNSSATITFASADAAIATVPLCLRRLSSILSHGLQRERRMRAPSRRFSILLKRPSVLS